MAITYQAAGAVESESAITTYTVSLSGAQPGDVVIFNAGSKVAGMSAPSVPAGAVALAAPTSPAAGAVTSGVWWWVVPSPAPANFQVVWSSAVAGTVSWIRLRGDAALSVNAFGVGAWATVYQNSVTAPAVTTTEPNCYVLGGVMAASGSDDPSAPSGWTQRVNAAEREGHISTKGVQSAAGSTGSAVFPSANYNIRRAWQASVAEAAAPPPPLQNSILGIPSHEGVEVSTRSTADSVRIKAGTNSTVTAGVAWSSSVSPDSAGWCKATVALSADTQYWYQVECDGDLSQVMGPFRTAPIPGTLKSFDVCFGGDLQDDEETTTAFDHMAARSPAFVFSTGDTHNGDNTSSSQASHRLDWENIWSINPGFRDLIADVPFAQSFGDHDQGGGNNSIPGVWTAPNIEAYQQVFPYPPSPLLPATTGWSFVWGRVRFVAPDWGHERTASYKLGPAQMAWLESELNQPEPLKVLIVGSVWYDEEDPEGWPSGDGWTDYATQRAAIAALIEDSPGQVLGVHGDQHALAAMSGAGNPYGGFPVVGGSPWSGWPSHKGDVVPDSGRWPTTETSGALQQYGRLTFTDTGDEITVQYRGYDTADVQRVTLTFTVDASEPVTLDGQTNATSGTSGSLTVRRALAGTVAAVSATTGALSVSPSLDGQTNAVSGTTGSLSVPVSLDGQTDATSSTTGAVTVTPSLDGQVDAVSSASGTITRDDITLDGQTDAVSGTSGTLAVLVGLDGQVNATSGTSGAVSVRVQLDGETTAVSGTSGALRITVHLDGQTDAVSATSGTLGPREQPEIPDVPLERMWVIPAEPRIWTIPPTERTMLC